MEKNNQNTLNNKDSQSFLQNQETQNNIPPAPPAPVKVYLKKPNTVTKENVDENLTLSNAIKKKIKQLNKPKKIEFLTPENKHNDYLPELAKKLEERRKALYKDEQSSESQQSSLIKWSSSEEKEVAKEIENVQELIKQSIADPKNKDLAIEVKFKSASIIKKTDSLIEKSKAKISSKNSQIPISSRIQEEIKEEEVEENIKEEEKISEYSIKDIKASQKESMEIPIIKIHPSQNTNLNDKQSIPESEKERNNNSLEKLKKSPPPIITFFKKQSQQEVDKMKNISNGNLHEKIEQGVLQGFSVKSSEFLKPSSINNNEIFSQKKPTIIREIDNEQESPVVNKIQNFLLPSQDNLQPEDDSKTNQIIKDKIQTLTPENLLENFDTLNNSSIKYLTKPQLQGLDAKLALFKPEQLKYLTSQQISFITPRQIKQLNDDQINAISFRDSEKISSRSGQVKDKLTLTFPQIKALTSTQLDKVDRNVADAIRLAYTESNEHILDMELLGFLNDALIEKSTKKGIEKMRKTGSANFIAKLKLRNKAEAEKRSKLEKIVISDKFNILNSNAKLSESTKNGISFKQAIDMSDNQIKELTNLYYKPETSVFKRKEIEKLMTKIGDLQSNKIFKFENNTYTPVEFKNSLNMGRKLLKNELRVLKLYLETLPPSPQAISAKHFVQNMLNSEAIQKECSSNVFKKHPATNYANLKITPNIHGFGNQATIQECIDFIKQNIISEPIQIKLSSNESSVEKSDSLNQRELLSLLHASNLKKLVKDFKEKTITDTLNQDKKIQSLQLQKHKNQEAISEYANKYKEHLSRLKFLHAELDKSQKDPVAFAKASVNVNSTGYQNLQNEETKIQEYNDSINELIKKDAEIETQIQDCFQNIENIKEKKVINFKTPDEESLFNVTLKFNNIDNKSSVNVAILCKDLNRLRSIIDKQHNQQYYSVPIDILTQSGAMPEIKNSQEDIDLNSLQRVASLDISGQSIYKHPNNKPSPQQELRTELIKKIDSNLKETERLEKFEKDLYENNIKNLKQQLNFVDDVIFKIHPEETFEQDTKEDLSDIIDKFTKLKIKLNSNIESIQKESKIKKLKNIITEHTQSLKQITPSLDQNLKHEDIEFCKRDAVDKENKLQNSILDIRSEIITDLNEKIKTITSRIDSKSVQKIPINSYKDKFFNDQIELDIKLDKFQKKLYIDLSKQIKTLIPLKEENVQQEMKDSQTILEIPKFKILNRELIRSQ